MTYDMNAVYGHTLDGDVNTFPDDQKRGFIIYGDQESILGLMEKAYAYVQSRYPECDIIRKHEDGTLRDLPVIDTSEMSEEVKKDVLNMVQGFYIDNKFTVGSVEVKSNRQWICEAFGITDFPEYAHDDEYDVEVESTDIVE